MNAGLGDATDIIGIMVSVIVVAAMLVWVERRLLAVWQDRLGPNRVGPFGLMQVAADMIKMFFKEDWIPPFADKPVFVLAPTIVFITMLTGFAVIPFAPGVGIIDFNFGLLYFLALSSLSVYSIVLAGYASNNKYSLLGGLRAAAQTVSYEVFMGISIMGVVMLSGTFNLREIVEAQRDGWFIIPQFLGFIIFLIAVVAESRRTPLDLPEAEQELVAGFHTEYSGMKFGMFFVGEYLGITLSSAMIVTLFFGGWLGPWLPPLLWFCLKTAVGIMFFILLRGALPRPRYDQLMGFGWKVLLPAALLNLLVTGGVVLSLHSRASPLALANERGLSGYQLKLEHSLRLAWEPERQKRIKDAKSTAIIMGSFEAYVRQAGYGRIPGTETGAVSPLPRTHRADPRP